MRDSGILKIYTLTNTAAAGEMPTEKLVNVGSAFYDELTVGVTRLYAALGANQKIDALVRAYNTHITGEYVILEDGNQYQIQAIQKRDDHEDLTLTKVEDYYEVVDEQSAYT